MTECNVSFVMSNSSHTKSQRVPYIQGSAWEGFHPVSQAQLWDSAVIHTPLASCCFQTLQRSTAVQFTSQPATRGSRSKTQPDPFLASPSELMETAAELLSPGWAPGGNTQSTALSLCTALLLFTEGAPQPSTTSSRY